jgi:phospholipid/cholesterol/gamma-HCH transport system ATP-binding protein
MATTHDIAAKQGKASAGGSMPIIAVDNLHKSFGSHRVLNGISLSVGRGETLAVLGRSGTGKSVLLRLLIGLDQPDSGSVCIDGQDLAGLTIDQIGAIRKKMGFLFQHAALYDSLTVAQNVAFPLQHNRRDMSRSEQCDRVAQLLAEVGMEGDLDKMPSDISGGMQKRVGLDPISSGEIDDLVLKLQRERKMASIVVTHDLHSAKVIANRLALLDQGSIVIEGKYEYLEQSDIPFVREFLK